jgi:hypothetical protein
MLMLCPVDKSFAGRRVYNIFDQKSYFWKGDSRKECKEQQPVALFFYFSQASLDSQGVKLFPIFLSSIIVFKI